MQPQYHQRTVLLVDGDLTRAEKLARRLGGLNLDLRIAPDGATGLLQAHQVRPDAVVVDAAAPILDGFRFLDALRSQPHTRDIAVILITEGQSHDELARGWINGADLCIPRNHSEADVLATLHRALSEPMIRPSDRRREHARAHEPVLQAII
jgi:PleD family two-component response regulator